MGLHYTDQHLMQNYATRDGPILAFADTADTADTAVSATFLLADTDTADTKKSANMPIFPIPILVSAQPYTPLVKSANVGVAWPHFVPDFYFDKVLCFFWRAVYFSPHTHR